MKLDFQEGGGCRSEKKIPSAAALLSSPPPSGGLKTKPNPPPIPVHEKNEKVKKGRETVFSPFHPPSTESH